MTLYEFNLMERDDKLRSIWNYGTHIDNYITSNERCALYGINKFYVEVVFLRKRNEIHELRSFKNGKYLDKYLPKLNTNF